MKGGSQRDWRCQKIIKLGGEKLGMVNEDKWK